MNQRKKPIQTGLEIKVKPVSDRGMTEEEYRAKIAEIQKQRETMEVLDKLAEAEVAKRKPRGPVQRPQPLQRPQQPTNATTHHQTLTTT